MGEILKSLRRTPYQSVGTFFTLCFSFFILILFTFTILLLTKVANYIETQPQVTVYFLKTAPDSAVFKLRESLLATGKVKEARFISKNDALKIYKDLNRNEPLLLEMVNKEALPSSLEVYTTKPEYLQDIATLAKKEPGVEDVSFQQDVINNLIRITNSVRIGAFTFLVAQFLVVFFVIFTTITFKLMLKKDELELQRLLGANKYFIIRPLLRENLFLNFLASVVSLGVFIGGYYALQSKISAFLLGIPSLRLVETPYFSIEVWPPNAYFFIALAGLTFLVGYAIIWLTTFAATSKYLK